MNNPPIPPAGQWIIDQQAEITRLRAELETERRKVGLVLLPIVDDVKAREGHQYEEENWNPDCHVQLELTVREFRAIRDALAALTPSEKGETK